MKLVRSRSTFMHFVCIFMNSRLANFAFPCGGLLPKLLIKDDPHMSATYRLERLSMEPSFFKRHPLFLFRLTIHRISHNRSPTFSILAPIGFLPLKRTSCICGLILGSIYEICLPPSWSGSMPAHAETKPDFGSS